MNPLWRVCLVLLFPACAPLAATPAGTAVPPAHATSATPDHLRVVAIDNYPPYLLTGIDGTPQGYVVDRWKLFEAHTGMTVELRPTDYTEASQAVLDGSADVIDMVYRSSAREAEFDFSEPWATIPTGIYVARGVSGVHDVPSLAGLEVAVTRGSACAQQLKWSGLAQAREYANDAVVVKAAVAGGPKVFCMDETRAARLLDAEDAGQRFDRAFVLYSAQFRWAVRKGNHALFERIARGMVAITPEETAVLRERWLSQRSAAAPDMRILFTAGALLVLLAAIMLLWVWTLRRAVAARTRDLQAEEANTRRWFDATPDAMWVKDLDGTYRQANDHVFEILGLARKPLVGLTDAELFPPELIAEVREKDANVVLTGQIMHRILDITVRGEPRHLEVIDVPLRRFDGSIHGTLGTARDITDRLRAEAELRLAAAAFEVQEALVVMDVDGIVQRVNKAFTALTGFLPEDVTGQFVGVLDSGHHDQRFYADMWARARRDGLWQGEQWIRCRQDQPKVVRGALTAVKDQAGGISHFIYSAVDLTSEREAHASVGRLTFFDPLTELPNRRYLLGRLQHLIERASDGGALLLIDLDHFKRVNDLRGHAAGDQLLSLIADRLRTLPRADRVLSRFSGGTFALLVEGAANAGDDAALGRLAEEMRARLREPFALGDNATTITASIGWTRLSSGQATPEAVLKEAELAMYSAKAAGRDQVRRFEPAMLSEVEQHDALVQDLRQAIDDRALELYLQGQVDHDGRVLGAEALLRWTRPDGERVSPDRFIPIAEDNGLIEAIGSWVLGESCRLLTAWEDPEDLRGLCLAVNVSARQFAARGFVEHVLEVLARAGANPTRLKLEVTESTILDDIEEAAAKLRRLRQRGIRVSLDDFGTGYSSLAYLSRLPLDQLKIDKSFVARLPEDANDSMVAQTIIGMGRGLGLEVIAEGVETEAQLAFLRAQGCDAFQGYLYSRPIPAAEFPAWVAAHAHRQAD